MVKKEFSNINNNKSCGPEEIYIKISRVIAFLLIKSMGQGVIPKDWKRANVSLIYKKGSRNCAENYRPISLTSLICKLMETFVKRAIMNHLTDLKLLSDKQYGFINGRSTTTQLLRYLDKCIEIIANNNPLVVDSIYLDFAKVFDSVPHRGLIGKLDSYGIKGNILNWINAFLSRHTQVVKVNGAESSTAPVLSGIPQGSVLGPTLFVIYINDLLKDIKSEGLLFADGTKIFNQIKTVDDALTLQADIDLLERWSKMWLLKFHPDKCHVLTVGKFEKHQTHPSLRHIRKLIRSCI